MDPITEHLLIKVQVFHQSEDPHVTMENRKYRLLFSHVQSKDRYCTFWQFHFSNCEINNLYLKRGRRVIGISGSLNWSKP